MRRSWMDFFASILREGEGGAGGGGDGGGAPAADAGGDLRAAAARALDDGQGGAGGDPAAPAAPPQPYLPAGLPEALRGASDQETIDKLLGDIAGRPAPPEKAEDYNFTFGEDFTNTFGDLKDDPVLPLWQNVAHTLGLSNAQAQGAVEHLYGALDKAGLIDRGPDGAAEMQKLQPGTGDQVAREQAAARRVKDAEAAIAGFAAKGLSKEGVAMLGTLFETAAGVQTIEFFAKALAVPGLQTGGQTGAADGLTAHEKQMRAMYPSMFKS